MATSGSTDYTMTARDIVKFALRKCGVLGLTQSLDNDEAANVLEQLELMLKTWQLAGPYLWKKVEGSKTLTSDTASYTLSTLNPLRILSIRYRNTDDIDLPMEPLLRDEYFDLPDKSANGIPTTYYFDPQRGAPTLYVWPVLKTATTETFQITYQKRIEDVDSLDNNIDIPQEWLETVGYNLAARILDDYPDQSQAAKRILIRAETLLAMAMDYEREDTISFYPSQHGSRHG